MPSFELSKLQAVTGARALSDTDRTTALTTGATPGETRAPAPGLAAPAAGVSLEVGTRIDTQSPPVDADRVAQIREALKDGSYPLLPPKIADAIIAAQISFGIVQ